MYETAEAAAFREVKEETRLIVKSIQYLFSIPNIYNYSNFEVHTVDMFFKCKVDDFSELKAQDDVSELLFIPPNELNPSEFGLISVRKGVEKLISQQ